MSKIDKIKEEIGWLKVVFAILVATDISLIGWIAQNYQKAESFLTVLCGIAVVIVSVAVIRVNKIAYKKIDELEDL